MLSVLPTRIRALVPRGRFARRLAMLSSSFAAGQVLIVASMPILTRLNSPEDFGAYAVFTSLVGILGNVVCLRFEYGVPVGRNEKESARLMQLSILCCVGFSALTVPAVYLGGGWLARVSDIPELAQLLWLLPLSVIGLGSSQALSFWSVLRGTFRLNALSRVGQSLAQALFQVGFGLAGIGATGLILGYGLAYFVRLVHFGVLLSPHDRALLTRAPRGLWRTARRNWQYPAYSAPAALMEASSQLLPPLILAVLFGPAVAGWYGLGQRLLGLPVRLLAQAASQVYMAEATARRETGVLRLMLKATAAFLGIGLAFMLPLLLFGPQLFAVLFGEDWRFAGEITRVLVPQYLARFVVTPVAQTLTIYGRQSRHLLSSGLDACSSLVIVLIAAWAGLSPLPTVLALSIGSTLCSLLYLVFVWRVARRHQPPATPLS